jgi:hypothetical protein
MRISNAMALLLIKFYQMLEKQALRCFIFLMFSFQCLFAQYSIKGRVTDARTGEPLPFVVIQFKGTNIGAQSDFDGYFSLKTSFIKDSLQATYVGYITKTRVLKEVAEQTINFQLLENSQQLGEVVVKRGENPAWRILRLIQENKDGNNKKSLTAYEYESYTKTQIDVDNISKKMRKNKLMKPILAAIDSMKKVTNDEGKVIIPVYMSETMSNIYYKSEPYHKKEIISANKITGIMDETNGNFMSQLTGSTFTEFNFYENWMRFLGKDFVSPIAASWRDYYEYDLEDSLTIDNDYCYLINMKPNRPQDLAFTGRMWITKKDYALKRIDVSTGKGANINFVEKIKIQQDFQKTEQGPWLTKKLRFLVDMAEIGDSTAGFLVKFYVSNKNFVLNQPKENSFFDQGVEVLETASEKEKDYWEKNRHDSLSEMDKRVIHMVDTVKNLPIMRTYVELIDIVVNGHKKVGWIEFGNYLSAYSWNNVEGHRLRIGFRTNMQFHKKLQIKGFFAFSERDLKPKYGLGFDYWFSKKKWFLVGAEHNFDIDQVALHTNYRAPGSGLFYTFARWGNLDKRSPFYYSTTSVYSQIDYLKGCTQKIQFNYEVINPILNKNPMHNFGFFNSPTDTALVNNNLTISEIIFESRFAKRETFLFLDHRRLSGRVEKWPVVTFRYHLGLKGVLGSNFSYHKFSLNLYQRLTVGKLGQSIYNITAFYTPNVLPFPLLNVHLGNETFFYNPVGFSMMRFFEFVSDKSIQLNYQHHFNGLIFNRIPLLKKLKWREVVSFNVVWGMASVNDQRLVPQRQLRDPNGNPILDKDGQTQREFRPFGVLDPNIPYAEVGYGIENIFKIFRVEVYHRLSYLENLQNKPNVGVKVGIQLSL